MASELGESIMPTSGPNHTDINSMSDESVQVTENAPSKKLRSHVWLFFKRVKVNGNLRA
ncbi:hypothetical protein LINPERPRIM_LOCUS24917, partial [Linum perenne]